VAAEPSLPTIRERPSLRPLALLLILLGGIWLAVLGLIVAELT
jgi:hypothetical protein